MVQQVNGELKEKRGQWNPKNATTMLDLVLGNPIEKNSRRSQGGEGRDPSPDVAFEAMLTKHFCKMAPPKGIQGLLYVELEEEHVCLDVVKSSSHIGHINELSWMLLLLMKAICAMETISFICRANLM